MSFTTHPRFKPYSLLSSTSIIVPFSTIGCEISPAHIRIFDLREKTSCIAEIHLNNTGPVEKFSCHLDLEKGNIEVSGFLSEGFFRYEIEAKEPSKLLIKFHKIPKDIFPDFTSVEVKSEVERKDEKISLQEWKKIVEKDLLILEISGTVNHIASRERLMLGSHKSQDVEMMRRRADPTEILPIWFFLSQSIPYKYTKPDEDSLFSDLALIIQQGPTEKISSSLLNIFKTGFESLFLPSFCNYSNLGFKSPCFSNDANPLDFLCSSYPLIRSIFFRENDNVMEFLPANPPQFHSGKLLYVKTLKGHTLSFEWSKKTVRKVIIELSSEDTLFFNFKSDIKTFRIRELPSYKEIKVAENKSNTSLNKGIYILDKFQK